MWYVTWEKNWYTHTALEKKSWNVKLQPFSQKATGLSNLILLLLVNKYYADKFTQYDMIYDNGHPV